MHNQHNQPGDADARLSRLITAATLLEETPEPGSEEWLRYGTASKAAIVTGHAPKEWGTRHSLYHRMRGTTPPEKQSAVMARGHEFEPMICNWFAEQHPHLTVVETGMWVNNERTWQAATPDRLAIDEDDVVAGVEAKSDQHLRDWGEPGPDARVPLNYTVQTMWQMDALGLHRVYIPAVGPFELFNRRPKVFVIDYDAEIAEWVRTEYRNFLDDVAMGFEPPADYSAKPDRDALRWQYTAVEDDTALVLDDELAIEYLAAKAAEKVAKTAAEVATAKVAKALGTRKNATWNSEVIAHRKKGRGGGPPSLSAVSGLADRAQDLLAAGTRQEVA